ncbi:PqqD family protein [Desulfofustis glycolicus]|uniref:Coenzyme PQQ synthesis protein D (PqqD) n=1 Tax=Desulfofustis glycolicus DSM 9705 TaxID=1121409 RepID=A0A1M5U6X0_9BACT|nr:PqqD family protein [Desulfofustis glycolicus]MCB2214622.1 PqqD family protein [Desulfobulbaceae bacterium]SHH58650.1 Coenzyme PQQ synthesis protein D (PqqD) [Desulfofustis glycolicus DSM 9705]
MDENKTVNIVNDYRLEPGDGEHIVYHPILATSVYLNDTGAIIWQLCDGTRTVAEIIAVLTECYPESAQEIRWGVRELLSTLVEKQIATMT